MELSDIIMTKIIMRHNYELSDIIMTKTFLFGENIIHQNIDSIFLF